jgi:hypothetical protein
MYRSLVTADERAPSSVVGRATFCRRACRELEQASRPQSAFPSILLQKRIVVVWWSALSRARVPGSGRSGRSTPNCDYPVGFRGR